MIFAESQEEFDELWEQMKADAEEIGIDKVVENAKERFAYAKKLADEYVK